MATLKEKLAEKIPTYREEVKSILKNHGDKVISEVTIAQAYGGMRGVKGLVCETSALDPEEGIRFRGYSIPELCEKLPAAIKGGQPLPEGLFYLLLLGDIPTEADVKLVQDEFKSRAKLPEYLTKILDSIPTDTHPMTQFATGILCLQKDSAFAAKYREGIHKTLYWEPMLEDSLNLLAKLPALAAYIYRRSYKGNVHIPADPDLDWGGNFAHMMGVENPEYKELMRLYLVLHSDHESGNVSAHTTHLVASALSDAYLSLSAGINGLAGPLHGLANQEVLRWIIDLRNKLGGVPTQEQLSQYVWDTLNSGQVIPGYGHAVLRKTDPRFTAQLEFGGKYLPNDEIYQIIKMIYETVPDILLKHGKAKNPWPNVDADSGCLQYYYGVKEFDFYTVLFGVSRAMGVLSQIIWDRAAGYAIERPKSITTEWIKSQIK